MQVVKFKKLHEDAQLPTYSTEGAGGFDIAAVTLDSADSAAAAIYGTGLAVELPKGKSLLLLSRSGHGFKQDIRLSNCVGLIDSDYRGEIKAKLRGDGKNAPVFAKGDRIMQGIIINTPQYKFEWVEELSETQRGTGGFGSTG